MGIWKSSVEGQSALLCTSRMPAAYSSEDEWNEFVDSHEEDGVSCGLVELWRSRRENAAVSAGDDGDVCGYVPRNLSA
jgi:hypothetical protein